MFERGHTRDNIDFPSEKIKKAYIAQNKFNCTLKCAYRSIVRHWPIEHAWEDEIRAKMKVPCVLAFGFPFEQMSYISEFVANFYPPKGCFPFFAAKYHMMDSNNLMHHTWGQVKELCNTQRVRWIFRTLPLTISESAVNYEMLYYHIVVEEGIRDVIGFSTTLDDQLPLLDYFSARNAGVRAEVLAPSIPTSLKVFAAEPEDFYKDWPSYLREEIENPWLSRHPHVSVARANAAPLSLPLSFPIRHPLPPSSPRLNLFGNDPATSISLRKNKAMAQQALQTRGLNYIRSVEACSASEAEMFYGGEIPFPVVAKPTCGYGSSLVTLCHTAAELQDAFRVWEVQRVTAANPIACPMVVEEYIEGEEYVLNTVGFEGRHVVTDMWRSWKYPKKLLSTRIRASVEEEILRMASQNPSILPPVKVETYSLLYDRLEFIHNLAELPPEGDERRVVDYTLQCIEALCMRNGCSHCELRIDRRKSSPNYGRPVLIELNPRMQGDVPRSTELVGYDQFTLLVYLSAVASPFSPIRNQLEVAKSTSSGLQREADSNEMPCSLPWPPAPQLYRSLVSHPNDASKRITRHVVFLCADRDGYLFDIGVLRLKGLRTYFRHARGNLFALLNGWKGVYVSQTVDLLSSPCACVLQGTEEELRQDTEVIRRMEQATIPDNIKRLSRLLISKIRAAQAMTLQLYLHERTSFSNDRQWQGVTKPVSLKYPEDNVITPNRPEIDSSDRMAVYDKSHCTCESLLCTLNAENNRLHTEWENSFQQMPYPPLFISCEDFSLIQAVRSSLNTMIPYGAEPSPQMWNCSILTESEKECCLTQVAQRLNDFF